MYENGFHMWISAVGRAAMKRWLGILLHSSVNWWNVSLAWKACTELTWNTQHRWIAIFSTSQMFQHLLFFRSVFTISPIAMSSFNLICLFSVTPPPPAPLYRFLQPRHGDCHPAVWKLSFSRRKPQCSPPTAFHVGMFPSSVHEYMSCLCFFGPVSGY